jgi:tetratricopeptide (TPR) repeat protein
MPEESRFPPWAKTAAVAVGGSVVVGGAAYLAYRHFRGTDSSSLSLNNGKSLAENIKHQGNLFFQKADYAKALEKFNEAAEKCQEDEKELKAISYQNAAACLEKLGKYPECILKCTEALKMKPRYVKAIARRASAHSFLGEDEEALRDYTLVTLLEPQGKVIEKFIPQIDKAHQRIMRRELEDIASQRLLGLDFPIPQTCAQEWLRYSVIRDPIINHMNQLSEPTNEYERILADVKRRHYDDIAKRAAEEATNHDSLHRLDCMVLAARFYTFHNNLNKVVEWLGKFFAEYESLLNEEKAKYTDLAIAAYGIKAQISKTLEEAESYVKKAEELDPTNTDVRFGFAANAIMQKQMPRASEAMDHVLAVDPNHPYARFYRAHFDFTNACEEQHMSNIHNYIVAMEKLLEKYPRAPIFTYTVLSNIHSSSGNQALAIEILNKGLEAYPNLSEFVMLKTITEAKMHRGDSEGIEAMTRTFIDLCQRDPNNFEAQATYAKISAGKKDWDKAEECFQRASMLARQPQELQLVISESILMRANREAQHLFDTLLSEA